MTVTNARELLNRELNEVNDLIRCRLYSHVELVKLVAEHIIQSGGKRTRPMLLILVAKALNIKSDLHIELAAIIEFIHTATLLHDDVVDGSILRRGLTTANATWGSAPSILVGDFLYSRAFQMMVGLQNLSVMEILANATNVIAEGEVLQLMNAGNPDTTEEQYLNVIRCKTAELFKAATELGAVAANASQDICLAMAKYGLHLGMAYQITDDVLDYTANSDTMGKNVGDDLAEGKVTLPLIYLLQHGTEQEKEIIREAVCKKSTEKLVTIQTAIKNSATLSYCQSYAKREAEAAIAALKILPQSEYKTALHDLAKFSYQRNH